MDKDPVTKAFEDLIENVGLEGAHAVYNLLKAYVNERLEEVEDRISASAGETR